MEPSFACHNDVAIKFLPRAGSKGDLRGLPCATRRQDPPGRNLVDVSKLVKPYSADVVTLVSDELT